MTEPALQLPSPDERVLLHELNHRINNEFAAAISAVSVAAARSSDRAVKAALSGVGELLQHYADVHRALQTPDHDTPVDAATYLRQTLRLNKPLQTGGQGNQTRAFRPPSAVTGGTLLAARNDPLRAHHQRCAPRVRGRGWGRFVLRYGSTVRS
jgi:Histidine kinase